MSRLRQLEDTVEYLRHPMTSEANVAQLSGCNRPRGIVSIVFLDLSDVGSD